MADEAKVDQASSTTEDGEELDEERKKRLEEERNQAEELFKEARSKATAKLELKLKNTNAGKSRPSQDDLKKLDGSVKKNSGFVKKLRNVSEQQRAALVKDISSINLTKYVAEAANSIAEAKLKVADVSCAVHICSLLHQRYAEFSTELLEQLQKIYTTGIGKDEDKSAVTTKFRLGLRLTGELLVAGVVDEEVGCTLLMDMLTTVTKADKDGHPYLSVVLNFARHCSEDLAGILPRRHRQLMRKFKVELPESQLLPRAKQEQFRSILQEYFSSVRSYLAKEHKAMHKRERQNYQILTSKGEISEQRRQENETAQKLYDKLLSNTSTLAELLDEDMPDLPEFEAPQEQSDISIELQFPSGIADATEADPNSLWEDVDTRSFYEGITDIKPFVPSILYEGRKKTPSESSDGASPTEEAASETAQVDEDEEKVLEQVIKDTEEASVDDEVGVDPEEEEGSGSGAEPGASALLDEFIKRLPTLMNRKFVDEFAVEFCMTMNSKSNRKKLARSLFNVDRNRMDLIPFYARLAATLHPCLDDIAPMLVDNLVRDLRFQIKKKDQVHIHSKLKNVRFLAELTKFGLCPKAETMKCITLLLHDFTHHNLEMACLFIEHCGRYLIRSPDSHLRAKALLEIMVRKKRVQHLDGRQRSLVENALYYANPPETPQIVHVSLPPMLQYIQKLLYKDLYKNNTEKILKQMRKLPWSELDVFHWAVVSLTQIWNVKFNNIHCVANLLAGLKPYQEDAVIRVVDGVLEDIRLGLELNIPKMNQRRFAGMKFLGELYSYQLVESNVVFRTLYLMLQFGAMPDGRPSPLDRPDSYFRVRLVCILLDTCGHYFDHGSTKKKLDAFLIFFQCYLFVKRQPLPLEVDHMVQDTMEGLRPDLQLFKTHQEAVEAALDLEKKYKDKIGHEDEGGEESDDEEDERAGGLLHDEEGEEEDEGEGEGEGETDDLEEEGFDEPNQILDEEPEPVLKTAPKLMACPEDDDFLSAFEKMMNDEIQISRTDATKVPVIDTAVPMHLKGPKVKQRPLVHEEGELRMKFTLMTKKGHKQQLKDLAIPIDSDLASNIHEVREAMKDQHQELKKLVLNYEQKQEEEEYQAMVAREREEIRKAKQAAGPQRKQQPLYVYQQQHTHADGFEGSSSPRGRGGSQYSYGGRGRGGGGGKSYSNDRPQSGQQSNSVRGGRGGGGGGRGGGRGRGDRQKRGSKTPHQSQSYHHHHYQQEQQWD